MLLCILDNMRVLKTNELQFYHITWQIVKTIGPLRQKQRLHIEGWVQQGSNSNVEIT